MRTYFLDLETTGLDTVNDEIIEIAIVNADDNDDCMHTFVKPSKPIPAEVTAITGISEDDVKNAPPFADIAERIASFIKSADCIGGHNILKFDLPMLANNLARHGLHLELGDKKFFDTLVLERKLCSHSLGPTYKRYYGKDFEGWHGAMADTRASIDIARAQMAQANGDFASLSTTIGDDVNGNVARNAMGDLVWQFGKCKNKPVVDDIAYARWVLSNDNFPASTKRCVRKEFELKRIRLYDID